jgi:hypothetical protein
MSQNSSNCPSPQLAGITKPRVHQQGQIAVPIEPHGRLSLLCLILGRVSITRQHTPLFKFTPGLWTWPAKTGPLSAPPIAASELVRDKIPSCGGYEARFVPSIQSDAVDAWSRRVTLESLAHWHSCMHYISHISAKQLILFGASVLASWRLA